MPILLWVFNGTQCLYTNVITHVPKRVQNSFDHETEKRDFKNFPLLLMFWNTYLYRHVCALTPARIRKTQIQNVDKMPVMRKNGCLKEEKEVGYSVRLPDQRTEMQNAMHKQEHSIEPCRNCCELMGFFGWAYFYGKKVNCTFSNFPDMMKSYLALIFLMKN